MAKEFTVGMRIKHPTKNEWGVGQIVSVDPTIVTVFFESVGEKKLNTNYVALMTVEGAEAKSQLLDSKLNKKRSTKRAFQGAIYFNDGKSVSRKKFVESLGGTCRNWNWSWSFTNHNEKKIFFGAWQDLSHGNRALIFSGAWKTRRGRNKPSWPDVDFVT